ncbi:MAG: hypothetical protein Q4F95_14625 [Oscillospiraceae bacterium]|nr:hypothetical protein [Oscillospiraceae bacterium]
MIRKDLLKRILAGAVSASLICTAFSCQSKQEDIKQNRLTKNDKRVTDYFEYKDMDIPAGLDTIMDIHSCSSKLFISGMKYSDEKLAEFYTLRTDEGKLTEYEPQIPAYPSAFTAAGGMTYSYVISEDGKSMIYVHDGDNRCTRKINVSGSQSTMIYGIAAGPQGNIYIETLTAKGLDLLSEIIVYDPDGIELSRINTREVCGQSSDGITLYSVLSADEAGYLYTVRTDIDSVTGESRSCTIYKLDSDLKMQLEITDFYKSGTLTNMFVTQDGHIAAVILDNDTNTLHINIIDSQTGGCEAEYEINNAYTGCRGRNAEEIIYCTTDEICAFSLSDRSSQLLYSMTGPDAPAGFRNGSVGVVTDDDRIILYCAQKNSGSYCILSSDSTGNVSGILSVKPGINSVNDTFCISHDETICYSEIIDNTDPESEGYCEDKPAYTLLIHVADNEGMQLSQFEAGDFDSYPVIDNMACDNSRIYFTVSSQTRNDHCVYIYDIYGNKVTAAEDNNINIRSLVSGRDNVIYALVSDSTDNYYLVSVSPKGELSERIDTGFVPDSFTDIMPGNDRYDILYSSLTNVCGYNFQTEESDEIISWTDSEICCICRNTAVIDSDSIACIKDDGGGMTGKSSLVMLSRSDDSMLEHVNSKKVITAAAYYPDEDVISETALFNKNSDSCRISLKDYSVYNTQDDSGRGLSRLSDDILSGNTLDIIFAGTNISLRSFAAGGLLADLNVFLDKDTDIKREDYLENIYNMSSLDGKLYQIIPDFSIASIIGKESVVSQGGWNIKELIGFAKSYKGDDMFYMMKSSDLEKLLIGPCMNEFVDASGRSCSFDSEGFKELLEFIKNYSSQSVDETAYKKHYSERFISDRCAAEYVSISGFSEFGNIQKAVMHENASLKGLPRTAAGNSSVIYESSIAVFEDSENKDMAWQFVRGFLLDNYQNKTADSDDPAGFPVKLSALERMREKAQDPQNNAYSGYDVCGDTVNTAAISDEDADMLTDLIKSTDTQISYDQCIMDIISDEARAYYDETDDLDHTVAGIQRKAARYLEEKY